MATDPVSAFLQGFHVVDSLETNRQLREFREEEQSRMRTMWRRQDMEYERMQLERYRGEKLAELDGTVQQIVSEVQQQAEKIKTDQGEEAAADYLRGWFGNQTVANGRIVNGPRMMNEAIKRMVQSDPDFGEHVMLALGRDPAAGELVDRKRPVASLGVVPAELDPNGNGGIFAELNTKFGELAPMTKRRSSDPDDPIDFVPVDMGGLNRIFGPEVGKNTYFVSEQLRGLVGAATPTGDPRANQAAQVAQGTGGGQQQTQPPPTPEPEQTPVDPEPEGPIGDTDIGPPTTVTTPTGRELPEGEISMDPFSNTQEFFNSLPQSAREYFGGVKDMEAFYQENPEVDFLMGVSAIANHSIKGFKAVVEDIKAFPKRIAQGIGEEDTTGRPSIKIERPSIVAGKFETDDGKDIPAVKESPTDVVQIRETGANPSTFQPERVAANPDKAMDAVGVPVSGKAAAQMANDTLVTANNPRIRRPGPVQMYRATSLALAGVLTQDQLVRFAETGSLTPAAKAKLTKVNDDTVAFWTEAGNLQIIRGLDPDRNSADPFTVFKNQREMIKYFPQFLDEEGNPDMGKVQEALAGIKTATNILQNLGVVGGSKEDLTEASMLNSMVVGQRFVDNFDPDTAQSFFGRLSSGRTLDWWPFSDPELAPENTILGYMADQVGAVTQEDADNFLFDYGILLRNAMPSRTPENYIATIVEMERFVRNKAGPQADQKTIAEIRRKTVRDSISHPINTGK